MSALELVERYTNAMQSGASLDWRRMRDEIIEEHRQAATTAERVLCLGLHKAVMDSVERNNIEPEKLQEFRDIRVKDYRLLLIQEAMIGKDDGLIDPQIIGAITRREVAAGRMAADDDLHTLAVAGATVLTPPPQTPGIFNKLRSWFNL